MELGRLWSVLGTGMSPELSTGTGRHPELLGEGMSSTRSTWGGARTAAGGTTAKEAAAGCEKLRGVQTAISAFF